MASLKITEYNPGHPAYGPRLADEEWENFKAILIDLDNQGIGRRDIVRIAAERHGFRGTYAAMNKRFKKWGLTNPRDVDTADTISIISTYPRTSSTSISVGENLADEDDNKIDSSAMPKKVSATTHTELSRNKLRNALDELILSTSNLSVEDAGSASGREHHHGNPAQDSETQSMVGTQIQSKDTFTTFKQSILTSAINDDETEATSAAEGNKLSVPETDGKPVLCPPKRSHSQVSSFASCEFGFGRSSQSRSFMHLAKRIRHHKPTHTPVLWESKFSWESSGRSGNFAAVTGFESDLSFPEEGLEERTKGLVDSNEPDTFESALDLVYEELEEQESILIIDADELPAFEHAAASEFERFEVKGFVQRNPLARLNNSIVQGIIPDIEFKLWRQVVPENVRTFNTNKRMEMTCSDFFPSGTRPRPPVVTPSDIARLVQKYPESQAVLFHADDDPNLFYLLGPPSPRSFNVPFLYHYLKHLGSY